MKKTKLSNEDEINELKENFERFKENTNDKFSNLSSDLKIIRERSIRSEERQSYLKESFFLFKKETSDHFNELKESMDKISEKIDSIAKDTWTQKGKLFVLLGVLQIIVGILLKLIFKF